MIISCMSFSSLYFLHLERISVTDIPGVSSMIIGEAATVPALSIRRSQSPDCRRPVRISWASTLDSMASIRLTSCSWDISRLKITVGIWFFTQICWTRFRANAVLPIDGLAAIRIRSEGCSPDSL